MTNKEHYEKEILDICCSGNNIGVDVRTYKVTACRDLRCRDCLFTDDVGGCFEGFANWCNAEYKEPKIDWSKVPIDTPIYINLQKRGWVPRYFSHYDNGNIYYFAGGRTSFTALSEAAVLKEDIKFTKLAREEDIEKYFK